MIIDWMHYLLAYAGLLIHVLMKLSETPGGLFEGWVKKDWLVVITSAVSIPVILILCTDTSLKDLLPINHLTAFLAGYQTQSFLRTLSGIGGKYLKK